RHGRQRTDKKKIHVNLVPLQFSVKLAISSIFMKMAVNGAYHLDLDDNKRNVFVTQLNDRDDDDSDIHAFPVVKETGDKLIETGINTLQRTLLLKKEVERKDKIEASEKYIKVNEAKRRRAIQKYQTEIKLRIQKERELDDLVKQLEELKKKQKKLEGKVSKYKKYEDYLFKVIEVMPEDYISATDDKIKGIMMRHNTLSDSNKDLVDNLVSMGDNIEDCKKELDDLKDEHNQRKVSINSQLAKLLHHQEETHERNEELEQYLATITGDMRTKRSKLGVILMAVDNITEKCLKWVDVPLEQMSLEDKLRKIEDHLLERADVAKMARPTEPGNSVHKDNRRGSLDNTKSKFKKKVIVNG
ncbi:hypothetical protein KUTeg_013341, partial [Tegillarca granosa]